jgi:hypothetical protein
MTSRGEVLAGMIGLSRALMTRYFAGFTDSNRAAQLPHMPNHFAWTLGHCALTMHRLAERLDGRPLPENDFEAGVVRAAGSPPTRFGTEGVAFGSTPLAEADAYPIVARCIGVFGAAFDRFGEAVRSASDERLAVPEQWGKHHLSMGDLVGRIIIHNGMHSGQLVDLRRGLGLTRVVG